MNKLSLPTWLRDTDRGRGLRLECGRLVDLCLAVHRHRGVQLGLGVEEGEELEAGRGLRPPAHRRRDARGAWHRRVVAIVCLLLLLTSSAGCSDLLGPDLHSFLVLVLH